MPAQKPVIQTYFPKFADKKFKVDFILKSHKQYRSWFSSTNEGLIRTGLMILIGACLFPVSIYFVSSSFESFSISDFLGVTNISEWCFL